MNDRATEPSEAITGPIERLIELNPPRDSAAVSPHPIYVRAR